jgi:hypothetical protein
MSTFSSANQDFMSFCRITQAICRQPEENTGMVSFTGYGMSNGSRVWMKNSHSLLILSFHLQSPAREDEEPNSRPRGSKQ